MIQAPPRTLCALGLAALLIGTGCDRKIKSVPGDPQLKPGDYVANISGSRMAYHVIGTGPVLFVHPGGPGLEWAYMRMPEVEEFATVVYIEPIGTGGSSHRPGPRGFSLRRYVSDVEGLRSHLNVKKIYLLGHSHGGFVALQYALQHPERLDGLVLYDTTPTTGTEWQKDVEAGLEMFRAEPWFADATAALAEETHAQTDEELTRIFHREFPLYVADWASYAKDYEEFRNRTRMFVAPLKAIEPQAPEKVGAAPAFEVRDRLGSIRVPTLVIVGRKDFITPVKYGQLLHEGIKGSTFIVLERSGHMGHMEQPGSFATQIRSFIESTRP